MLLRTAPTHRLGADRLRAVRTLLDEAFEGDFSEDDWDHALGGVHVWAEDERGIAAHGAVVQRRLLHRGRSYRVGYVEGVAVRADLRRQGLGGAVMAELERIIEGTHHFGALSASRAGAALYRARGWWTWPGHIEVLTPSGTVRLAEEEGSVFLRPTPGRERPDPAAALVFDWRDGDVT
ncbi:MULTISPECIES: GNAT family N-acetyltransferase [unclassified Streptomyces]|uniref:GNAT family N-acetyltransferase n=1 Tax=unclassified Streptomyces TaxID=2593676 RepID=UPI0016612161|nr:MULTISPECIES: GNAT family N-acetyltransferase [unclassified Streptomyces]MBD0710574.1 aminoglycoside 2'-N-acetyltransferase [Streptomyces sp. CBMA291]MBD0716930.1 aminoglycoside 2'-N-acetyltransferase [Streptomyces sp. CBMA370]